MNIIRSYQVNVFFRSKDEQGNVESFVVVPSASGIYNAKSADYAKDYARQLFVQESGLENLDCIADLLDNVFVKAELIPIPLD